MHLPFRVVSAWSHDSYLCLAGLVFRYTHSSMNEEKSVEALCLVPETPRVEYEIIIPKRAMVCDQFGKPACHGLPATTKVGWKNSMTLEARAEENMTRE